MLSTDLVSGIGLSVLSIVLLLFFRYLMKKKNKNQLEEIFIVIIGLMMIWQIPLILQIIGANFFDFENPIIFDYITYIGICFLPVAVFIMSLIFSRTKITITPKYYLLFIIPIISLIILWTNNVHHLFYETYSRDITQTVFGKYFIVHSLYTYILFIIASFILIKYSIKNAGTFSKQAILIIIAALFPVIINIIGSIGLATVPIYATPMAFAVTIICLLLALFKFSLFKATPIALQRIVDRISDSYIIINEEYVITDYNRTLIETFNIKKAERMRGQKLKDFLLSHNLNEELFKENILNKRMNEETITFEIFVETLEKHFDVEISSIISNNQFLGTLILFKDITQHVNDLRQIQEAQESLMESERLSSLGQLIGGIAHNLKTPIMSISGAAEGLRGLVDEYNKSIDNPQVTGEDHHEIARDMDEWIGKIKDYTEYMSDIITAVRGQAVTLSATENISFDIESLIKRIDILMSHELKNAQINMDVDVKIPQSTMINGDINSLVQVINNLITNAIQSYNGKVNEKIDLIVYKEENDLLIAVKDYGCGLPDMVKEKLFKEMITTKGKNGTGLGLYMSYSTIKANFNGNITFESVEGKGTTFIISIPL